jgi:hypothetical protein
VTAAGSTRRGWSGTGTGGGGRRLMRTQDTEARVRLAREANLLRGRATRLAALCRRLIEAGWQGFPEDARASLRRSNPEHPVVVMERELAEITGGTP